LLEQAIGESPLAHQRVRQQRQASRLEVSIHGRACREPLIRRNVLYETE
jgi:hypothetical protein